MERNIRQVLSALAISIALVILIETTPSVTNIHPWITIGRVTYLVLQSYSYTGSPSIDICIATIILLIASIFLEKNKYLFIVPLTSLTSLMMVCTRLVLQAYLMAWITLLIYSLLEIKTYNPIPVIYGIIGLFGGLGAYKIFYVISRIITGYYPIATSPVWLNLIINYYSWPLIPISITAIALISLYLVITYTLGLDALPRKTYGWLHVNTLSMRDKDKGKLLLLSSLFFSLFLAVVPFVPSINPAGKPITTDYIYYYNWLKEALQNGVGQVIQAHGDRPLYILLLYTAMMISGANPSTVSALQDIVLFPLYTLSIYFLAKKMTNGRTAGYAALMAASSPILTSYAYGGFQADLFTLSITFIALSMILDEKKTISAGGLALLGSTMFLHEWTWTQYTIILGVYAVTIAIRAWRRRERLSCRWRMITLYLAIAVPLDLLKTAVFGLYSSARVVAVMSRSSSLMSFSDALHFYTTLYTGGSLDNTLFYILALPGVFVVHPLILVATGLSLITILIPYNIMYYRLLLNTPLPLLAGYTVSRMNKGLKILVLLEMIGLALLRILSFIPGLSLTW